MDKRIRRNEICVIGLPSCDYVFSSTRMCFISYGFRQSQLEMRLLHHILEARGIEPTEAGGTLAPAQNAFCVKICSKIVTSQFCIVLANNEMDGSREIPNSNVHMEYGLMLGFNKYVIPFQKADQRLPFNVAGLDTVKYTDDNFERRASEAIDQAIAATRQTAVQPVDPDQVLTAFLLTKNMVALPLDNAGDRSLAALGRPLGFHTLVDFSGMTYAYFGNFTTLRPEVAVWRLRTLQQLLDMRRKGAIAAKVAAAITTVERMELLDKIFDAIQLWVLVTSQADKDSVVHALEDGAAKSNCFVFSVDDVREQLQKLGSVVG